jgi:hypothetical protein
MKIITRVREPRWLLSSLLIPTVWLDISTSATATIAVALVRG